MVYSQGSENKPENHLSLIQGQNELIQNEELFREELDSFSMLILQVTTFTFLNFLSLPKTYFLDMR